ncbi:restriction endonuclease subunit S [Sorangium sp. So ce385]|uniref:restriction endonuclease subunit S n=1 Tax=Sorangium sp. So ce385 TaxID=3133308 RepID=UPI003F5B328F
MTDFHAAPDCWMRKQLKWAVTFQRGHDLPDDAREEGPVPVYAGGGITGWHKESCAAPPGIVTGRYGTIGEFHLVSTPYWPLNTALYSIDLHDNYPEYLRYLLEFLAPLFHVHAGKSAVPGVDRNDIHTIPVALPGREQQRRIAALLGRETRRIDGLLAAKQRLLDLLAEKRKAIIATAVTRGLDPKMKLRDSGVPWLGEIPAHWETERARWLFRERDVRSETGEEEMLTVSHLTGVTPRSEKDVNMFEAETNEGYKLCEPGDLVINTLWAWMGAMGIAPVKGIVSPAYNVYEPGPRLTPAYIDALVRLPVFAQEVTRFSKGVWSSRLRLYPEGFFEVYLPVPPQDEQHAIVEHIARETAKLDAVRTATERTIALLRERRSALIAAAVTGQLDVRAAA